ncbi:rhomboid family intramembrane serine protease [Erythrobacter sp. SG61-1L]|uniref:rhomboid family intramembrane serine protease n=1 Tax=Erythrobacter sp. SG61-1L TaxID=1603897 RepID=UPI0006C8F109|nr:rhomboid family intramembrane serine protease [Erythrobacter sp. SG61-1L]
MVTAFVLHLPRGTVMYEWAISAQILRAGYWQNVLLHMFAHAGFMHIAFNCLALASLSPHVAFRLGSGPGGWLRYIALFICCGLAGLAMFLAIHPNGTIPMLGASGAIFGFAGFLVRYPPGAPGTMPLLTRETGRALADFVKTNLFLIAILTLPALLAGQSGGVAWEGHLGGFLFGLLAAPAFVPRHAR